MAAAPVAATPSRAMGPRQAGLGAILVLAVLAPLAAAVRVSPMSPQPAEAPLPGSPARVPGAAARQPVVSDEDEAPGLPAALDALSAAVAGPVSPSRVQRAMPAVLRAAHADGDGLGAHDLRRMLDLVERVNWAADAGDDAVASLVLRLVAVVAESAVMDSADLDRARVVWRTVVADSLPLSTTLESSAWESLGAMARSPVASPAYLESLAMQMTTDLLESGADDHELLHALRVLDGVVANPGARLEALRLVVDAAESIASHSSPCAAAARDTLSLATRRLGSDPTLSSQNADLCLALASRSFVAAARLANGSGFFAGVLCADVLLLMGQAPPPPIHDAARALHGAGVLPEVISSIGGLVARPAATEVLVQAVSVCASIAASPWGAGAGITGALWAAVCSPHPAVGLRAAWGFLQAAASTGADDLWRVVGLGGLARVGRCLAEHPGALWDGAFAEKVSAVLEGTELQLRGVPPQRRPQLLGGLRALCRAVRAHAGLVASTPSVDRAVFERRFAAVCRAPDVLA